MPAWSIIDGVSVAMAVLLVVFEPDRSGSLRLTASGRGETGNGERLICSDPLLCVLVRETHTHRECVGVLRV